MDEKIQDLLNAAQQHVDEMGAAACGLFSSAGQTANSLLALGKLNVSMAELKAKKSELLQQVGEMVYGTHTGEPTSSDALLAKLQEIDDVCRQIDGLTAEIARVRTGMGACPLCGANVNKNDKFCGFCGNKL